MPPPVSEQPKTTHARNHEAMWDAERRARQARRGGIRRTVGVSAGRGRCPSSRREPDRSADLRRATAVHRAPFAGDTCGGRTSGTKLEPVGHRSEPPVGRVHLPANARGGEPLLPPRKSRCTYMLSRGFALTAVTGPIRGHVQVSTGRRQARVDCQSHYPVRRSKLGPVSSRRRERVPGRTSESVVDVGPPRAAISPAGPSAPRQLYVGRVSRSPANTGRVVSGRQSPDLECGTAPLRCHPREHVLAVQQ